MLVEKNVGFIATSSQCVSRWETLKGNTQGDVEQGSTHRTDWFGIASSGRPSASSKRFRSRLLRDDGDAPAVEVPDGSMMGNYVRSIQSTWEDCSLWKWMGEEMRTQMLLLLWHFREVSESEYWFRYDFKWRNATGFSLSLQTNIFHKFPPQAHPNPPKLVVLLNGRSGLIINYPSDWTHILVKEQLLPFVWNCLL